MGFPGSSVVKNPPVMQEMKEMQALSLGREDVLEEEMTTYSSILVWSIPWMEPGVHGVRENRTGLCTPHSREPYDWE